jgi:hypothetical protein
MSGAYPQFQSSYSHEELVEHFLLTPADLQLVLACRGEANRCDMALLMKALNTSATSPMVSIRFPARYAPLWPGNSACSGIIPRRIQDIAGRCPSGKPGWRSRSNRRNMYGQPDYREIRIDGCTYFHSQK